MANEPVEHTLIRIEERLVALSQAAEHRHANLKMAMEGFMPRREIELVHDGFEKRIASLESDRAKVAWALVGTIMSGVTFAAGVLWKLRLVGTALAVLLGQFLTVPAAV